MAKYLEEEGYKSFLKLMNTYLTTYVAKLPLPSLILRGAKNEQQEYVGSLPREFNTVKFSSYSYTSGSSSYSSYSSYLTAVNIGSSTLPIYINSSGYPTACGSTLAVSITGNAATATTANTALSAALSVNSTYSSYSSYSAYLTAKSIGSVTHPIYINSSGYPAACNTTLGVSITGNAATASKVKNSIVIKTSASTVTSFNGSAAQTINKVYESDIAASSTYSSYSSYSAYLTAKSIGSVTHPIYINSSGYPAACNTTLGVSITGNAATATTATTASKVSNNLTFKTSSSETSSFNGSSALTVSKIYQSAISDYAANSSYSGYTTYLTATSIGSSTHPIYINSSGYPTICNSTLSVSITGNAATATTATTANKVSNNLTFKTSSSETSSFNGSSALTVSKIYQSAISDYAANSSYSGYTTYLTSKNIGSSVKPIYVNSSGAFTASSSTVGSSTKPIYLNSGTLTASSSSIGSGINPIYMSSGTLKASTSNAGSKWHPIFLEHGILKECTNLQTLVNDQPESSTTKRYLIGAEPKPGYSHFYTNLYLYSSGPYFLHNNIYYTSDKRLKTDIKTLSQQRVDDVFDSDIDLIKTFRFKNQKEHTIGFVAQDIMAYFPEAVSYNDDNNAYTVNYNAALSGSVGVLFKKVKEQDKEIKKLKKENKALKDNIKKIMSYLNI